MRVLVACEESQAVCISFRQRGHEAFSCDIQPFQFGHPWSKRTCLWLKGLPLLKPTLIVEDFRPFCSSGSYSKTHDRFYAGASRAGGASFSRSKTFKGIAEAMADQWGGSL